MFQNINIFQRFYCNKIINCRLILWFHRCYSRVYPACTSNHRTCWFKTTPTTLFGTTTASTSTRSKCNSTGTKLTTATANDRLSTTAFGTATCNFSFKPRGFSIPTDIHTTTTATTTTTKFSNTNSNGFKWDSKPNRLVKQLSTLSILTICRSTCSISSSSVVGNS